MKVEEKYESLIFKIEHVDIIINQLKEKLMPRMEFNANVLDNETQQSDILEAVYEHEFHLLTSIVSDLDRAIEVIKDTQGLDHTPYIFMNCEICKWRKD